MTMTRVTISRGSSSKVELTFSLFVWPPSVDWKLLDLSPAMGPILALFRFLPLFGFNFSEAEGYGADAEST
jgi:hypothetical protein